MKKLGVHNPAVGSRGKEAAIADSLFPAAPVTNWDLAPSPAVLNIFQAFDQVRNSLEFTRTIPEFTPAELSRAPELSRDLHRVSRPDLQESPTRSSGLSRLPSIVMFSGY
ncbi:unnamed protein product [Macrosiphum euphorbiae]|uniref:Uncharacterized protein n=1 Tax=Macrosiphum euphorbiae TaxID=13131 RepID=A0AAV0Y1Y0_9HEMI|nr:unnamed protein product [Macrosiphum euphorbiae]